MFPVYWVIQNFGTIVLDKPHYCTISGSFNTGIKRKEGSYEAAENSNGWFFIFLTISASGRCFDGFSMVYPGRISP
jgi:hypothetical protein